MTTTSTQDSAKNIREFRSYKGQLALVTGASTGIGRALALDLASRGASLVLVARSEDKLQALAKEIEAVGQAAHVFPADLGEKGAADALYAQIVAAGLEVDLLINNAGYGRWGKFGSVDRTDYQNMVQLNIIALTDLCHLFISDMIKRGGGGIINTASIAAFGPVPFGAVYSASKSYVLNLTEALRYEYAPDGIQTMVLCPGGTRSNFAAVATEKSAELTARASKFERSSSYMSAEDVAKDCLDAFVKNKQYVITGRSNRITYAITRHFPRKMVLGLFGRAFGRVAG